jgi:hypothetical protein
MYFEVANRLYIGASGTAYSQAVSMDGANAVQVDFTAFSGAGTVTVEEGNDLENWSAPSGTPTGTNDYSSAIFRSFKYTSIASRYVRLKYVATSASVLGAGINTASL